MSDYEYNYTYVAPLAFIQKVPPQDRPPLSWYGKVVLVALKTAKNRLAYPVGKSGGGLVGMGAGDAAETMVLDLEHLGHDAIDLAEADLESVDLDKPAPDSELAGMGSFDLGLATKIAGLAASFSSRGASDPFGILDAIIDKTRGPVGRPTSMADYDKLFQAFPKPPQAATWDEDRTFADMRVAGWNPLMLTAIDDVDASFPVTDAHLAAAGLTGETLASVGADGRLFLVDYKALARVVNGNFPNGAKYVNAPKALFARPKNARRLVPVAIQCGQDPKYYPVFGVADGEAWHRAKIAVNCADANYHETISHLGRTHLIVGPFAIATPRRLPASHPISRLLSPHLQGTNAINDAAQGSLIAPGQQVDKALAGTIEASRTVAAECVLGYKFEEAWLPNDLAARRVNDPNLEYPYRDDALKIWYAIRLWVEANVVEAYVSDDALRADTQLAAWAKEVSATDGGRIYSFGEGGVAGAIHTREWLVDALTMLIFTASAQHAAVNFAQAEIMAYAPLAPVATYRSVPASAGEAALSARIDMFPPMEMAQLQLEFLNLLGGVHFGQLGQYESGWFPPALQPALRAFQQQLATIESQIDAANATRVRYTLLKPSGIPQSINI